jgi:hypothetical protein
VLLAPPPLDPADRILTAMRKSLEHPPAMVGAAGLDGRSLLVRRLLPQEDRLIWRTIARDELLVLARYLGTLVGGAHRRSSPAAPNWSAPDREAILERAVALAGIHESIHLALCMLP